MNNKEKITQEIKTIISTLNVEDPVAILKAKEELHNKVFAHLSKHPLTIKFHEEMSKLIK